MGEKRTILVVGATGNVGREVVAGLLVAGAGVRALVRNPDRADLPGGVTPVRGDLAEPETVAGAAAGVDGVFLLWPFVTAERAPAVVDAVAGPGRHVVYLSAMNVRDDQDPARNGFWGEVERLIERSGSTWTFLRASGFATNTLEWADQIRATGTVRWVYGGAARSLIHERDIAAVAVLALTGPGHAGRKYVLTGPEPVTQVEQVRLIGEAVGRPVRWVEAPVEQVRQDLLGVWGDAGYLDGALAYWAGLVTEPEQVTRTVQEVTGLPARGFREWAADHAADFAPLSGPGVARRYVSLVQKGRFDLVGPLLDPGMVRIAPIETGGEPVELRGSEAIMANSRRLTADLDIHRVEVDGPFLAGDRFAVRFSFDQTHRPTGVRGTSRKMSLYTVADGLIIREEVHYFDQPKPVG